MPVLTKKALSERKGRVYPFGVGDGTRVAKVVTNKANVGDAGENQDGTLVEAAEMGGNANDLAQNYGGPGVYADVNDGVEAQEQVINVTNDQTIKFVVVPADAKKDTKKEHPQERITKFWSNFEPEYLGGVHQILPDTVGETPVSPGKKPSTTTPTAVHSYDNARASCIKSVNRIIRECRANNQKYTDPHFDLERDLKVTGNRDCLYGLLSWDDSKDPGDVKRVTDIFEHPQFFKDGAGFDDIVQGAGGDCWLLAGLSAITANQELLRKVCVKQDQDVGVYGFVFHRDGDWHPCIIDDKLYLSAPSFDESGDAVLEQYGVRQKEQEKTYTDTQQKGSKALYFASCRDDNETWVPLLEKAYAKAHGDFTALDGGQVGEALEDLTGGITTEIYTTNILNKENFWRDLCRIGKDFIFSCHVSSFADWRGTQDAYEVKEREKRFKGIVEHHAYSVLTTYEGYGQRLVKIRNPWGEKEWNGAWSDGSKEWTADWLLRLEHKFGDDGVFWMSFDDMLKRYKYMDRTRLFGPEWYIDQEWTGIQVPWNSRDYSSTTFSIEASENTDAVIALSQLDDRYFQGLEGPYRYTLSFRVQKFGEDEDEDDYFARSPIHYELTRSTNVEVHLEKGKYSVLIKVEASKYDCQEMETVIRENIWRRDKVTQMATLYDLAFRKGRPIPEKKEEPKEEPEKTEPEKEERQKEESKKEEPTKEEPIKEEPKKEEPQKEEPKKEDTKPESESAVKSSDTGGKSEVQKPDKSEKAKPKDEADSKPHPSTEEKADQKAEPTQPQYESTMPPAVMAVRDVQSTEVTVTTMKAVPDEDDPNRNPWNASCVIGLRVYSKLSDLKLKVVRPGDVDQPQGVTLDRDDIAKAPLVEAEKAQEKQQSQQT